VFDTAILEIDKDVPPELLYEVVEEIRDVAVVKVPKHLRAYVEPKARDVVLVTERGLLTSTLKLAVQFLGYLGPLKAFRREKRSLVEVYSGDFTHGGRVAVEMDGGRLKIVEGPNRVVARCEDPDDFDVSAGKISMEGCEVEAALSGVDALDLDVAGGYAAASLKLNNLKIDAAGGVVDLDLAMSRGFRVYPGRRRRHLGETQLRALRRHLPAGRLGNGRRGQPPAGAPARRRHIGAELRRRRCGQDPGAAPRRQRRPQHLRRRGRRRRQDTHQTLVFWNIFCFSKISVVDYGMTLAPRWSRYSFASS